MSEYIGLISSVIGIVAAVIPVIFWLYKKHPSLGVKIVSSNSLLTLIICNKKEIDIEINHVMLVHKRFLSRKLTYDKNSFFSLVETDEYGFQSTQVDDLSMQLIANGKPTLLSIPYTKIYPLYGHFLPYKLDTIDHSYYLESPTKMITCKIGIFLSNGKVVLVNIPRDFYQSYREHIGSEINRDVSLLAGDIPSISINCNTQAAYENYKAYLLREYERSRKNYHLLLD